MTTNWVVLKFGGTSVSGRPQWDGIASLTGKRLEQGKRVLLVCSAVSGMTNALTDLADDPESIPKKTLIINRHRQLARELELSESTWLKSAEQKLADRIKSHKISDSHASRAELLAMGEWLSTRIGTGFLKERLQVSWVDARDALVIKQEPELSLARQWLSASCSPGLDIDLARRWETLEPTVMTQGYIAATDDGQTALLGRGGSDTSAALLAGRLGASELEIWTDVPGLFSSDPRRIPQARLLMELEYEEALEMAASGARVVHPRCIQAAAETNTPIVIRDTTRPYLTGTRITQMNTPGVNLNQPGVKSITCQKGMLVLLLQNIDTRREVGFLARVFDIFRRHGVSVDLVATSETTTTVAINGPGNHLDEPAVTTLIKDLEIQCTVEAHIDCVCINLVGRKVRASLCHLQTTLAFFVDHPLLMLSQSANDLCLSLLMQDQDHDDLLKRAHHALIPANSGEVFGPSWQELQV